MAFRVSKNLVSSQALPLPNCLNYALVFLCFDFLVYKMMIIIFILIAYSFWERFYEIILGLLLSPYIYSIDVSSLLSYL